MAQRTTKRQRPSVPSVIDSIIKTSAELIKSKHPHQDECEWVEKTLQSFGQINRDYLAMQDVPPILRWLIRRYDRNGSTDKVWILAQNLLRTYGRAKRDCLAIPGAVPLIIQAMREHETRGGERAAKAIAQKIYTKHCGKTNVTGPKEFQDFITWFEEFDRVCQEKISRKGSVSRRKGLRPRQQVLGSASRDSIRYLRSGAQA
ncbi:hypothetical protein GGI35DRAFT_205307 [Trichoderma velutinum]